MPDKTVRRDNSCQYRFWNTAQKVSNDRDIGLHVGEHFPVIRGSLIEYLFLSSSGFKVGLEKALNYQKLLSSAFHFSLFTNGHVAGIQGFNHPVRHYLEIVISVILKFLKFITDDQFRPIKIYLPYEYGATLIEYKRVWGCEVELGCPDGKIIFDAALLNLKFDWYEPELFAIHETYAKRQMRQVEKYELISDIEQILADGLLESGNVQLTHVADKLNMKVNTLRACLTDIDTSFEKILTHYRIRTAKQLLASKEISMCHIVSVLGFSESSVFSRAFKRWTGETPLQYRKRKTAENDSIDT